MQTILEAAKCMLITKEVNKQLWAEAIHTAVYFINRTGNTSVYSKNTIQFMKQ